MDFAAAVKELAFSFLKGLPKGQQEQGGDGQCHLPYQTLQGGSWRHHISALH